MLSMTRPLYAWNGTAASHQLINERPHFCGGEANGVCRKVADGVVQVNVIPHDLQRNVRCTHVHHLIPGVVDVAVSPPGQLEPEAPRGLPRREADELAVLLDHLLRAWARKEVEVERASE